MGDKLLNKISVKGVCGAISIKAGSPERALMKIVGIANGQKSVTTQYGDSIGLKGQFMATNIETGEVFRSGTCYLPGVATDMVIGALNGGNQVEFAFGVSVISAPSEDKPNGYEYRVASLVPVAENDPLLELESRLEVPALPAPKKAKK